MSEEYNIEDYIVGIYQAVGDTKYFIGTGFAIDGYLVTAGHVVEHVMQYYIKVDNQGTEDDFLELDWYKWKIRTWDPEDINKDDIALYPMPDLKSPLVLSTEQLELVEAVEIVGMYKGEIIKSIASFQGLGINHVMYVLSDKKLTHGISGCPILKGNKVVGIATGGFDDGDPIPEEFAHDPETFIHFIRGERASIIQKYINSKIN